MTAGILLTLCVGLLWSFVGVFYKTAAKKNLSIFNISLVTNTFSLSILWGILIRNTVFAETEFTFSVFPFLFMLLAGAVNMSGSLILQRSMIYGHSGVAWAIGQSALIVPFFSITLIFCEEWNLLKLSGSACILCGMVFLGMKTASANSGVLRPRYGILLAFVSFAVLGIAQSMMSAGSYIFPGDTAGVRPVLLITGSILAAVCGKYLLHDRGFRLNRTAWLLILLMGIQGVVSVTLQFKALDLLKAHGMNGIFFPVAVGTCIAGYTLWSFLFFREQLTKRSIAGIAAILCGILCYALN